MSELNDVISTIFKKGDDVDPELKQVVKVVRELGGLADVIGRRYDLYDKEGKFAGRIIQRPMTPKQINTLSKALHVITNEERKGMTKGLGKGRRR